MIEEISKLWFLFNKKERIQILFLLISVILMALVQVAGVASIFPFMHLVMEPDIIENSSSLNIIYNFFEFPCK